MNAYRTIVMFLLLSLLTPTTVLAQGSEASPPGIALQAAARPSVTEMIAFASDREPLQDYSSHSIFRMNADGGNVVRLSGFAFEADEETIGWDLSPAWSPDGRNVAFATEWFDWCGVSVDVVTTLMPEARRTHVIFDHNPYRPCDVPFSYSNPDWSPNGQQIAFTAYEEFDPLPSVSVYEYNTGAWVALADGKQPSWSPDGTKIAFTGMTGELYYGATMDIYVMNADGSNLVRLTNTEQSYDPDWSSDGQTLVFTSEHDGNPELYTMSVDGSNMQRLTHSPAVDKTPAWSPNGERIAFTTDRDGNEEIYVMQSDGSNPVNLSNNPASDVDPAWGFVPAGPIVYLSPRAPGTVANLSFADEDILRYDPNTEQWSIFFDGSDVGLKTNDVDGFAFMPDGSILMSVLKPQKLQHNGTVTDHDVFRFIPQQLGPQTAGTFERYFDGSHAQLTTDAEDVDAVALLRSDLYFDINSWEYFDNWERDRFYPSRPQLVMSTNGRAYVPEQMEDEDLMLFDDVLLGPQTQGDWHQFLDGSQMGLTQTKEDTDALWIDNIHGTLYMSTANGFAINGVSGTSTDVFACDPFWTTEWNDVDEIYTAYISGCDARLAWSGRAAGLSPRYGIDGLALDYPVDIVLSASLDNAQEIEDVDDVDGYIDDVDDYIDDYIDEEGQVGEEPTDTVQERVWLPVIIGQGRMKR